MVVVLDRVEPADLEAYRRMIAALPNAEKCCGFFCGRKELAGWPPFDALTLALDTRPLYGELEGLLPPCRAETVREALRVSCGQSVSRALPWLAVRGRSGPCAGRAAEGSVFCRAAGAVGENRRLHRRRARSGAAVAALTAGRPQFCASTSAAAAWNPQKFPEPSGSCWNGVRQR